MIYAWKPGMRAKVPAQIAGEVCSELEREGRLTAQELVDVSRPEDAPLHKEFEWDDSIAAEEYRKVQARRIIAHITIKEDETDLKEPMKAFFTVEKPRYESVKAIFESPDKHQMLLEQVRRELIAIKKKYRMVSEFNPVWDAIDSWSA